MCMFGCCATVRIVGVLSAGRANEQIRAIARRDQQVGIRAVPVIASVELHAVLRGLPPRENLGRTRTAASGRPKTDDEDSAAGRGGGDPPPNRLTPVPS